MEVNIHIRPRFVNIAVEITFVFTLIMAFPDAKFTATISGVAYNGSINLL